MSDSAHEVVKILASNNITEELSPVFRLPVELLSTIFGLVRDLCAYPTNSLSWIRVSHVCTRWRLVALGCPSLWAKITFGPIKCVEEMLIRSKMAPLEVTLITLTTMSPLEGAVIAATLEQLHRVQELHLFLWLNHESDILKLIFGPAPILELCKIHLNAYAKHILPDTFFCQTPSLRRIMLANCGLYWESLAITNLIELSVTGIPEPFRPSVHQVLLSLSHLPRLECLTLRFRCTSTAEDIAALAAPKLLYLRTLSISSRLQDCVTLLDSIVYPNTAVVDILLEVDATTPTPYEAFQQRISEKLTQRLFTCTTSLRVQYGRVSLSTLLSLGMGAMKNTICNRTLPIQVSFCVDEGQIFPSSRMTASSMRGLSLQHIGMLDITDSRLESTEWLRLFGNLPRLRTIRVGHCGDQFLLALSKGTSHQPNQGVALKFKALRHVIASEWKFDEKIGNTTCVGSLKESLRQRQKNGVGLTMLELEECRHVEQTDVDELKTIVPRVDWDEQSNYTTEEEDYDSTTPDASDSDSDF